MLEDPEFADLSTEALTRIDQLVSRYESERRRGQSIDIDPFISGSPTSIRSVLQRELVRAEAEILSEWGDGTALEQLAARWPAYAALIEAAAAVTPDGPTQPDASVSTTVPTTVPAGSSIEQVAVRNAGVNASDWNKRFVIRSELAEGGLGQLFVAHDLELDRNVAIKVLKRQFLTRHDLLARFQTEATVTSHLEHPNIVPVYARGVRPCGQPYFAMRLIKGQSLKSLINETYGQPGQHNRDAESNLNFRSDPTARDLLVRLITVCRAVAYAHNQGWVHRDLKPGNIMVGPFGETVIIDWGLATRIGDDDRSSVGTAGYMSPEQSKGLISASHPAADIYSLGCILYCILTNRQPETPSVKSSHSPPEQWTSEFAPAVLRPARELQSLPAELDAICRKATAIAAENRYVSAEALADDLEAWLADEPTSVIKESRYQRLRRRLRSNPGTAGATLGAVAAGFVALLILLAVVTRGNASLQLANAREQAQTKLAEQATRTAEQHAAVSQQAQQRLMQLLRSFILDVEQELAKVPGSSSVRRQILTTSLNQLSQIMEQFGENSDSTESRALALLSMGDLLLRFGKQDLKLDIQFGKEQLETPNDAANYFASQAQQLIESAIAKSLEPTLVHRLQLLECKAIQRRADVALIKGDLVNAGQLAEESLRLAEQLKKEKSLSPDAAESGELLNWWAAVECCGRVWKLSGQQEQLVALMHTAVTDLEAVVGQQPENESLTRSLGMAHVFLGDAAFQARDLALAKTHYEADLAISEKALRQHPDQVVCRRDLAVSLDRVGNIYQRQGEVERAIEIYERGQSLRRSLYEEDKLDQNFVRDLYVSHMKVGDAHMLIKHVDLAAEQYEAASQLSQQMVEFDSKNMVARRFQSMSAEVLADVCIARGRLEEALHHAEESLKASIAIQEIQPASVQAADDVLIGHLKVAKVYQAMEDWAKTITRLKLAIEIAITTEDQSFARLKLIEVLLLSGDASAARELCQELVPRINTIVDKSRQDSVWRRRQYQVFTMLGQAELALDQKEPARKAYTQALELTRSMIADRQRVETVQADAQQLEKQLTELTGSP